MLLLDAAGRTVLVFAYMTDEAMGLGLRSAARRTGENINEDEKRGNSIPKMEIL